MLIRFYKFFHKNIVGFLTNDGCEIVNKSKHHYMINFGHEDFIIPRYNNDIVKIYVSKEGVIKDIFMTKTKYIRVAEKKFKNYYKKRLIENIFRYE